MTTQTEPKYSFAAIQNNIGNFLIAIEDQHKVKFSKTNVGKILESTSTYESYTNAVLYALPKAIITGGGYLVGKYSVVLGAGLVAAGCIFEYFGASKKTIDKAQRQLPLQLSPEDKVQIQKHENSLNHLTWLHRRINDIQYSAKGNKRKSVKMAIEVFKSAVKDSDNQDVIESSENLMKQKHDLEQYLDNMLNSITNGITGAEANFEDKKPGDHANNSNKNNTTNTLVATDGSTAANENNLVQNITTTAKAS